MKIQYFSTSIYWHLTCLYLCALYWQSTLIKLFLHIKKLNASVIARVISCPAWFPQTVNQNSSKIYLWQTKLGFSHNQLTINLYRDHHVCYYNQWASLQNQLSNMWVLLKIITRKLFFSIIIFFLQFYDKFMT